MSAKTNSPMCYVIICHYPESYMSPAGKNVRKVFLNREKADKFAAEETKELRRYGAKSYCEVEAIELVE